MNIKENQKFQSTHKAIMEALLELLHEKNIQQVTVSELCRKVGINRSTFYLHFLDVYDVLEKMAELILTEMVQTAPPPPQPMPEQESRRESILHLLEHIRRHQEFYTLYFQQGLPLSIQQRFFQNEVPPSRKLRASLGALPPVQEKYHRAMFAASFDAALRCWLERGCIETPEELYEILEQEFKFDGITNDDTL